MRQLAIMTTLAAMIGGCAAHHESEDGSPSDLDGGARVRCGGSLCAAGDVCCNESCGICTAPGEGCIALHCVPTPCGLDDCGVGEQCCESGPPTTRSCEPIDLPCPVPSPATCDATHPCGADMYCDTSSCGGPGLCLERPDFCTEDCPGVCGCDGENYCNGCMAAQAGVAVASAGACALGSCAGRDYCDCSGDCVPLIDTTTGCVCSCDEPFNCTGIDCACVCGGATYLGCAVFSACPTTEISCVGCTAILGADGCPTCPCDN